MFLKNFLYRFKYLYFFLIKLNYFIKRKDYRVLFYNVEKDILNNKKIYDQFNLAFDSKFKKSNKENISIKYKLFTAISKKNYKDKKILEIGTWNGEFTKLLSKLFPESTVYSIDLPHSDDRFVNSYERKNQLDDFLKKRNILLSQNNIKFIEMDSQNLLDRFDKNFFDIIWVDGDHHDPVVTQDIFNSYELLKKGGLMIIDDLLLSNTNNIVSKNQTEKVSTNDMKSLKKMGPTVDSMKALKKLSNVKNCQYFLLTKFYGPRNFFKTPYNAILKK